MTMRITIKNADETRTARVTAVDGGVPVGGGAARVDLAPGQSNDFYIHEGRTLAIEEIMDEPRPAT